MTIQEKNEIAAGIIRDTRWIDFSMENENGKQYYVCYPNYYFVDEPAGFHKYRIITTRPLAETFLLAYFDDCDEILRDIMTESEGDLDVMNESLEFSKELFNDGQRLIKEFLKRGCIDKKEWEDAWRAKRNNH